MSVTNITLAVIAGLSAGYVMWVAANWLEGVLGMPRNEYGHQGVKLMGGEKPGWWAVGILAHHMNSVLLSFAYAGILYPRLGVFGLIPGDFLSGFLGGLIYGVIVFVLFANALIGGVSALAGQPPQMSARGALAGLVAHLVYGAVLGVMYIV